jgi:hypothetical protein
MRRRICRSKPRPNDVLKVRCFFCGAASWARPVAFKAALQFWADMRLVREWTFGNRQLGKLADGESWGGRISLK